MTITSRSSFFAARSAGRFSVFSIACAAVLSLGVVACGSSAGDGVDAADGGGDGAAPIDAADHMFVVSAIDLPTTGAEAMALGSGSVVRVRADATDPGGRTASDERSETLIY